MENVENREGDYARVKLEELFSLGKTDAILELIEEIPNVEVCEFLSEKTIEEIQYFLSLLSIEERGSLFSEFDIELQHRIFTAYDKATFSYIFENMPSAQRADLYQDFDKNEQAELLPFLTKKVREDVIVLSSYPPETAGGIMSTDFATVVIHMTAEQALAKIRRDAPSQKMIYYIYVVDINMRILGLVTLKDLILCEPQTKLEELVNDFYVYAEVNEDREEVAKKIEKYDLVAIPVLNQYKQLLGIVGHDDAIDVIQEEHTEDLEKLMGIMPSDEDNDYLDTTSLSHFKRRIAWIIGLAVIGILSGLIIQEFEGTLKALIVLAVYMPMMTDTGGNSGSQAATVVIRAMALGEVEMKDWFKVLFKEAKIALMVCMVIGIISFIKIYFFSSPSHIPAQYSLFLISISIALALSLQVISSTLIGAGLPMIVKRLNGDPAVVASPAITTIVDITGLLIYFSTVKIILGV